jgi:hypothetical protein
VQGLKSLDVSISSACASAVDNLATFYFKNVVREPESGKPAAGAAVSNVLCCIARLLMQPLSNWRPCPQGLQTWMVLELLVMILLFLLP